MKSLVFLLFLLLARPVLAQAHSEMRLHPPRKSPFSLSLDEVQKARLMMALTAQDKDFDLTAQLLQKPVNSPGYHTTVKTGLVHPTREAALYAVALLDEGDAASRERAIAVLSRLLALQDTDPKSKTYGLWSWFEEEPLSQMAPPDWNWADFIGVQLLQVALYHRETLPAPLLSQVDTAIARACRSIIRREVKPDYTNIAVMDIYVTLVAGELFDAPEFRAYGLRHLQIFADYTRKNGGFSEYNSPTYTITALQEVGRMRLHVHSEAARSMVEEIYQLIWQEIAEHFHVPTRQWAGPQSRSYSEFIDPNTLALIQTSTQNRVSFGVKTAPSLNEVRFSLPCPPDLESLFSQLNTPRELVKRYLDEQPPLVGTTYLAPDFTLGTINRGDMWNQRRDLLAYAGDSASPASARLRFLHDNYDFSCAQFFSSQKNGRVVGAINFALDGGDTHVSLDPLKNATFRATDLRLRLEISGPAAFDSISVPDTLKKPGVFRLANLDCTFAVPFAQFGDLNGHWESGHDEKNSWIDVVLYHGDEQDFDLRTIQNAALGFALQIGVGENDCHFTQANGRLEVNLGTLRVNVPTHPALKRDLQKDFETSN